MNNRIWIIATAMISIVVLALGWFLGISPQLDQAVSNLAEKSSVEATNADHEVELAMLMKQFESIDEITAELEGLREQLPPEARYAEFLRQVDDIADSSKISFATSLIGNPEVFVMPAAQVDSDSVATEPEADAPQNTLSSILAIPITLEVTGSYRTVLDFVQKMQTGTRIFLVTGLSGSTEEVKSTVEGVPSTSVMRLIVSGYIYVVSDPTYVAPETESSEPEVPEEPEEEAPTPAPTDAPAPVPTETTTP